MDVALDGRPRTAPGAPSGAIATLPAPVNEYAEDVTEALWLARALTTGRPVTGGASGWVPPTTRSLRTELAECEDGRADPGAILTRWRAEGIALIELALRPDDPRVHFWRTALVRAGARRVTFWPQPGYETWAFD